MSGLAIRSPDPHEVKYPKLIDSKAVEELNLQEIARSARNSNQLVRVRHTIQPRTDQQIKAYSSDMETLKKTAMSSLQSDPKGKDKVKKRPTFHQSPNHSLDWNSYKKPDGLLNDKICIQGSDSKKKMKHSMFIALRYIKATLENGAKFQCTPKTRYVKGACLCLKKCIQEQENALTLIENDKKTAVGATLSEKEKIKLEKEYDSILKCENAQYHYLKDCFYGFSAALVINDCLALYHALSKIDKLDCQAEKTVLQNDIRDLQNTAGIAITASSTNSKNLKQTKMLQALIKKIATECNKIVVKLPITPKGGA